MAVEDRHENDDFAREIRRGFARTRFAEGKYRAVGWGEDEVRVGGNGSIGITKELDEKQGGEGETGGDPGDAGHGKRRRQQKGRGDEPEPSPGDRDPHADGVSR